ncbi:hypothetical protein MKK88_07325 [Methylobacterium sp. E-005]|uniref:hypothetical protein n=1 Tax=Methylobacterium sp. E-005 TaxID=2836549 RepID=UPI001FB9A3CB|nr:hypothetical protein [Methylobacterium sp. E-005]MCJ2085804.1 hypothetical protein [Methylobacterium sp. E-005]
MGSSIDDMKELARALRAKRNEVAKRAADLRQQRGSAGDDSAPEGYLHGADFQPLQEQLEAVERAIRDATRPV